MDNNLSDDEDAPQLSAETLLALNEFLLEQNKVTNNLEEPQFTEDWELSQFWYDEETTTFLTKQVIKCLNGKGIVGCISCPTLYINLLKLIRNDDKYNELQVYLLEYDQRFASLGPNYVFYDYREPLAVKELLTDNFFDLIICDPPFLSYECLEKITQTINYLKKEKIILNTGAVLADQVYKLLQLIPCQRFIPRHKNNLGNQFASYTNFSFDYSL